MQKLTGHGTGDGGPRSVFCDPRYRLLLGGNGWQALNPAVQQRFGKRLTGGGCTVYTGVIGEARMSRAGRLLSWVCRLIGAPLPAGSLARGLPAVVTVTEDRYGGGQFWTRLYGRRRGFPQVIHSTKRFSGPTGLEELVGCGLGIMLTVHERQGALIFRSAGYFIRVPGCRLRLPAWLSPGRLEVGHHDRGAGRFAFTLDLTHPLLGQMIRQTVLFRDTKETMP